ncbi:MAG: glutamate--tRNA ligase [Verrucomicrobia bacterium]|nr:glutamate--tRNA ligase [Verrucomicrobiota bacterium]MDA1085947.1 glutamate--tRNA ligase [Verrucomicrobiota bacterium]
MSIRVRFAPSPTGQVHIGNIRAAIYNWLFARHHGGKFLLRVEDTDRERSTPEAVATVFAALQWLEIDYDEEPVYQSSRQSAHLEAAEKLLSAGLAYKADKGDTGKGEAVLFKMPGRDLSFHDELKGELSKKAEDLQDLVIVRSNGTPVFHLANVVDDIHMGITHVIRGDDHIENTYRHVALYEALQGQVPRFAHLPMIVNAQGKPYSKRDGAAFVGEFRDQGYRADAFFNYLVLLGWAPGDDREVMSRAEIVQAFDLTQVKSSAAQVDLAKCEWMNGEYIRAMPLEEFRAPFTETLTSNGVDLSGFSEEYTRQVMELMQVRTKLYAKIPDDTRFFFCEDFEYNEKGVRKRLQRDGALDHLSALRERLATLDDFTAVSLEECVRAVAEERGVSPGELMHPTRVAVSGLTYGPGLFEILEILGRDRVGARMQRVGERFAGPPADL